MERARARARGTSRLSRGVLVVSFVCAWKLSFIVVKRGRSCPRRQGARRGKDVFFLPCVCTSANNDIGLPDDLWLAIRLSRQPARQVLQHKCNCVEFPLFPVVVVVRSFNWHIFIYLIASFFVVRFSVCASLVNNVALPGSVMIPFG